MPHPAARARNCGGRRAFLSPSPDSPSSSSSISHLRGPGRTAGEGHHCRRRLVRTCRSQRRTAPRSRPCCSARRQGRLPRGTCLAVPGRGGKVRQRRPRRLHRPFGACRPSPSGRRARRGACWWVGRCLLFLVWSGRLDLMNWDGHCQKEKLTKNWRLLLTHDHGPPHARPPGHPSAPRLLYRWRGSRCVGGARRYERRERIG